jgi:hypothetical protein
MIYRIVWARVVAALQRGRADTISIKPPKILSDEGSASMSETSTIRTKINSLWDAYFVSSVVFFVFLIVPLIFFGFDFLVGPFRAVRFEDLSQSSAYKVFKELELQKLAPIAVGVSIAFAIYVFDRLVAIIGNFLPPFPIWHGSPALYVEAFVPRTAEHRMIGDLVFDTELAEPAIGQVDLDFSAQPALGTERKHIADEEHPDYQHRIN